MRGIKRKCQKTASIHSGALYQVTQCGRNEALILWGNLITPSINSGPLSSTLGLQPPPAGPEIGRETAGWGRDLPASVVFSAFPPSLSQAQSMPLCPQGPLPSGHGLNRQGGKGQGAAQLSALFFSNPPRGVSLVRSLGVRPRAGGLQRDVCCSPGRCGGCLGGFLSQSVAVRGVEDTQG